MRLTKFGHACVRMDKDGHGLVIDPGVMSPEPDIFADIESVLITHEHFDHFDGERLTAILADHPQMTVYTCPGVARHLTAVSGRVRVVKNGDVVDLPGFTVKVVGEKHHFSHPDAPPVDNVGFLVDDTVFHPGDALPLLPVQVLLVPGQAPWMTVPDLIAYLRGMKPGRVFAIHDGLLNHWGLGVLDSALRREADGLGVEIRRLAVGETVEV